MSDPICVHCHEPIVGNISGTERPHHFVCELQHRVNAPARAKAEAAQRDRDEVLRQEGRQQATAAAIAFFRKEIDNHEGDAEDLLLRLIGWFERGHHLPKEGP